MLVDEWQKQRMVGATICVFPDMMSRIANLPAGIMRLTLCVCLGTFSTVAADWPQYRGPDHNGVSRDRINRNWSGSVTNPVWRLPLDNALSSLAVRGGRVFTQARRVIEGGSREVCLALNAATGAELWATVVDVASYPNGGVGFDDGPRTTPAVDDDSVYVLTSYLKLLRLSVTNGSVIWSNNLVSTHGSSVIPWQNAASPVIEDGLIFLNANAGAARLMALSTTNGSLVWRSQNEGLTHSTPVLTTMHGARQLIFATQQGLVSLNPQTGDRLWRTNYPFGYSTSLAASPVVHGNLVFITGFYAMGSAAFEVQNEEGVYSARLLWHDDFLESHWSTPVCHQGFLYGLFTPDNYEAELRCIDLLTGVQQWAVGGFGRGAATLVNGLLLIVSETGELVLAEPSPAEYRELGRLLAIPGFHTDYNKCWNSPAVADGRVFVRSTAWGAMFDFSVPDFKLADPQFAAAHHFQFTVRSSDGTPVTVNRLTNLAVKSSLDPALPPACWLMLTNAFIQTNGTVNVTNLETGEPRRYFIVREPE